MPLAPPRRSFLQSAEWAAFKAQFGWQNHRILGLSILERPLPAASSFLYAPEVRMDWIKLPLLLAHIRALGRPAIFFRLEVFERLPNPKLATLLAKAGFRKAEDVQPALRLWIDLRPGEEAILARMTEKGRYNIKIAQRSGLLDRPGRSADFETFVALYHETARRHRFSARPRAYLAALANLPFIHFHVVEQKKRLLAAGLYAFFGDTATYLYGATVPRSRDFPSEFLHFQVMRLAKARRLRLFDFGAIGPADDPAHKWAGLRQFKKKFGGEEVALFGCFDFVYNWPLSRIFTLLERIRRSEI